METETKSSNQEVKSKTIETQFLNEKKETYLQLSADFAIMRYSPKSKPALQQFISLLLLDIALLLGCDIAWKKNPPPAPAQTVLEAGRASDDGDTSSASNDGGSSPVVGNLASKASTLVVRMRIVLTPRLILQPRQFKLLLHWTTTTLSSKLIWTTTSHGRP